MTIVKLYYKCNILKEKGTDNNEPNVDTFDGEMYPGFNYVEYPVGARIFAPNLEERVLHYSARAK